VGAEFRMVLAHQNIEPVVGLETFDGLAQITHSVRDVVDSHPLVRCIALRHHSHILSDTSTNVEHDRTTDLDSTLENRRSWGS
jgi:hypothetical protein